jgi:hypothetical protein
MRYGELLILGVVFAPVYIMLIGWFLGRPRELRLPLLGVGYLVGTTVAMWGGLALFAAALDLVFF